MGIKNLLKTVKASVSTIAVSLVKIVHACVDIVVSVIDTTMEYVHGYTNKALCLAHKHLKHDKFQDEDNKSEERIDVEDSNIATEGFVSVSGDNKAFELDSLFNSPEFHNAA